MESEHEVCIIGAGAMGQGIATHCALYGATVTLVDHRQENLDMADDQIDSILEFLDEFDDDGLNPESVRNGLRLTLDTERAAASSDLVIETVSEDVGVKQNLFETLADATSPETVLASNTSGIQIDAIADAVPDAAERVAGCHWWYPPYLLTPVEIVRGSATADWTVDTLESFVTDVNRDPIMVEKDVPGFVWNRVQFAVVRECLHIVAEGIASIEDVNSAIRDGYATRTAAIGPFETMDIAGLPLFETISTELFPALSNADSPNTELRNRVADGRTGVESGQGFFEYDEPPQTITERRDEKIAAIRTALKHIE